MPSGHPLIEGAPGRRFGAALASTLGALCLHACAPAPSSGVPEPPRFDASTAAPPTEAELDAGAEAEALEDASATDALLGDGDGASDADLAARPLPVVLIERPYLAWARPRPKGAVAAGAHDELLARWNLGGTSAPDFPSNRPSYHPGTRVKVETRVVSGKLPKTAPVDRRTGKHAVVLSETSLLTRSRKHGYWPYRLCFERAVQQRGKQKGGETVLRFAVDARGRVGQPVLLRTKLDATEVVECLLAETRALPLLPPPRRVQVELSVEVWPGDAALPSLPPAPADPALAGPLDGEALEKALEADRGALASCYAEGLARDPGLWGRLQVHVERDARGRVTAARQSESRFPDPEVVACVLGLLKETRLPTGGAPGFEIALRLGREPPRPAAATP